MKKLLLIIVVAVAAYLGYADHASVPLGPPLAASPGQGSDPVLATAFARHQGNIEIEGQGTVVRVLADDLDGSRHQRFLVRLDSGQTVLVAHNIDLAPRIAGLQKGDTVSFKGEYEWNPKGGVIHWTHHDPHGGHAAGWIKHGGQTYR